MYPYLKISSWICIEGFCSKKMSHPTVRRLCLNSYQNFELRKNISPNKVTPWVSELSVKNIEEPWCQDNLLRYKNNLTTTLRLKRGNEKMKNKRHYQEHRPTEPQPKVTVLVLESCFCVCVYPVCGYGCVWLGVCVFTHIFKRFSYASLSIIHTLFLYKNNFLRTSRIEAQNRQNLRTN